MNVRTKFVLRWTVAAFAVGWIAFTGANEYYELDLFRYNAEKNGEVLQRQLAECKGNFKERYECKSRLLRAAGTSSFYYWSRHLGVIFGPPFVLYVLYQIGMGLVVRREQAAAQARRLVRLEEKAEEERLAALEEARKRTIAVARAKTFRDAKAKAQKARKEEPIQALVVDQSEAGEKLCEELAEHGYTAVASTDPDDALIGFKTLPYRLVVTETSFNDNGGDVKEAIATMRKQKENLKVVAVSESFPKMDPKEIQKTAVELGADIGFPKPVEAAIFAEIGRRLLEVGKAPEKPAAKKKRKTGSNAARATEAKSAPVPLPPVGDTVNDDPPKPKD